MPLIFKTLLLKFYYLQLKIFLYNYLYQYYNLVFLGIVSILISMTVLH